MRRCHCCAHLKTPNSNPAPQTLIMISCQDGPQQDRPLSPFEKSDLFFRLASGKESDNLRNSKLCRWILLIADFSIVLQCQANIWQCNCKLYHPDLINQSALSIKTNVALNSINFWIDLGAQATSSSLTHHWWFTPWPESNFHYVDTLLCSNNWSLKQCIGLERKSNKAIVIICYISTTLQQPEDSIYKLNKFISESCIVNAKPVGLVTWL